MKRLELTQQTVRCPLEGGTASVTVHTDHDAAPSRRYVDVAACSLMPSTPIVAPVRRGYFSDVAPPLSYLCEVDPAPRHAAEVPCSKRCLATLNAAEPGASEAVRCTSGFSDSLELARQTQSPPMMRLLWFYGA